MTDGKKINLSAMISGSNKSTPEVTPAEVPIEEKKKEALNIGSVQQASDIEQESETITESKKVDIENLTSSVSNEKKDDEVSSQEKTQKNEMKSVTKAEPSVSDTKKKKVDMKGITSSVSNEKKDDAIPSQEETQKNDMKSVTKTEPPVSDTKKKKVDIKGLSIEAKKKESSDSIILEKNTDETNIKEEKKEDDPKVSEIFKNYSSDFNGKAQGIIKEIKKLKNLRKTNPKFLSFIVLVTILGISFLFYVDPKNHSYTNYKASLLNAYQRQINPNSQINTNSGSQSDQEEDITNDPPKITWSDLSITEWGFNLKIESQTGTGGALVYKFEGALYDSKEELDEAVKTSITLQKTRRIKSVISENFKRK